MGTRTPYLTHIDQVGSELCNSTGRTLMVRPHEVSNPNQTGAFKTSEFGFKVVIDSPFLCL